MNQEFENNPTIVSQPPGGASRANSSHLDEKINRHRAGFAPNNLMTPHSTPSGGVHIKAPDLTPFDDDNTVVRSGNRDVDEGGPKTTVISDVVDVSFAGFLFVLKGARKGQFYQLTQKRSEIGRNVRDVQIFIEDSAASGTHGAIVFEENQWLLHDFASTNGTFLNGERLGKTAPNPSVLNDGDRITIGTSEMVFKSIEM